MSYAPNTSVPIDRSQAEIKKILTKYGATAFAFAEQSSQAVVMFEIASLRIKFVLPVPIQGKQKTKSGAMMNKEQIAQFTRSRWRSLALAIKAKLECVESGIATIQQEFLSHVVLPNGRTVGDAMIPQIEKAYSDGKMPPLLGYDG